MSSAFLNMLLGTILLLLGEFLGIISAQSEWSYTGPRGVERWCDIANSSCCLPNQSPINLSSRRASHRGVEPFSFIDYDEDPESMEIINNGHTIEVTIEDKGIKPRISGGGLDGEYIFEKFHFHWGNDNRLIYQPGSEHTIDNHRYSMELHVVHYSSKFDSITEALESGEKDAVAVLGILYHMTPMHVITLPFFNRPNNTTLDTIVQHLNKLQHAEDRTHLTPTFPLEALLPELRDDFYRYWGSLTTPTCEEVVVWTVFTDTVAATRQQLNAFTKVYSTMEDEDNERLVNNYRPLQPINNRTVERLHVNP